MSFSKNLFSNYIANAWLTVISIALVPVYIHYIGIEAYGLMGIYNTLNAFANLLDMGFSTTISRETAKFLNNSAEVIHAQNLVRTMEVIYWGIGILIGGGVTLFAPFFAEHWVNNAVTLSQESIQQGMYLIGIVMFFQWPFSFYSGGLRGLQKFVLLGKINAGIATFRGVGAVLILWLISPTIQAFLIWQAFISLSSTIVVLYLLWHFLPKAKNRPVFQISQLSSIWRFSTGVSLVGLSGLLLFQIDKIILSKILTLENFGYYTLAGTVNSSLYMLITPVFNVTFPRMTQLVSIGDQNAVKRFYRQSTEVISVILLPVVVILALFSRQILFVWQNNQLIVDNTFQIVSFLVIGTGLHGLAHIPWALQLAHGWTKLGIITNICELVVLVPLIIVSAFLYGGVGTAFMWMIVNLASFLVNSFFTDRKFLNGEEIGGHLLNIGKSMLAILAVSLIGWVFIPSNISRLSIMAFLIVISSTALLVAIFINQSTRNWLISTLKSRVKF